MQMRRLTLKVKSNSQGQISKSDLTFTVERDLGGQLTHFHSHNGVTVLYYSNPIWNPFKVSSLRFNQKSNSATIILEKDFVPSVSDDVDIEGVLEGAQEQNHLDALEVRLYNALIFGQSEEVIEIFRLVSKKWLAESERIELKKREAEAQFKFKQVDMGETVESQEEIEEQEFLNFFATKNEFQSEAEGIPEAIDGAKEPSKDSLAKYQKFVSVIFFRGTRKI